MTKKAEPTKVIFRCYKHNGNIIALFPELPVLNGSEGLCSCYAHVGQSHAGQFGAVDPHQVIRISTPACPADYQATFDELCRRGYDLQIVQRCSPKMMRNRAKAFAHA
jgi:hypothetical protein